MICVPAVVLGVPVVAAVVLWVAEKLVPLKGWHD